MTQETKLNVKIAILVIVSMAIMFALGYLFTMHREKIDVKETPVLITPVEAQEPIEVVEVLPEQVVEPIPEPVVKPKPIKPRFPVFPILSETKIAPNGKPMCAKKNDKPHKSEKNPKWHPDNECCLDPYEIPNGACYYPAKYDKLINKYLTKFKK